MNTNEYGIWDYINLDLFEKPLPPAEPTYQTAPKIIYIFYKTQIDMLIKKI